VLATPLLAAPVIAVPAGKAGTALLSVSVPVIVVYKAES
jgi:hypothetical protein